VDGQDGQQQSEQADTDRQAAGSCLQEVTPTQAWGDGAMAPAFSMIVSDAILMTVHRAYHAERGAEPDASASSRPIRASISPSAGFDGSRSIGEGCARR
jgi:hypothetical protein